MREKDALIILSGGMDSVTMLHEYRAEIALAVTFDYSANNAGREMPYAALHCERLGVEHITIPLPFIPEHFSSALLDGAEAIPEGRHGDEIMKSVVVPFRNGIMLSIAAGIAGSRGLRRVLIANHMANHDEDHVIFPDCTEGFIEAMGEAIRQGMNEGVELVAPYTGITKVDIVRKGVSLGVDFSLTWSCYKDGERHCGKCCTCVERREAFQLAGVQDPTVYDE